MFFIARSVKFICPKRKTFKFDDRPGTINLAWKILAEYGPLPRERCERTCRQYFECRAYLVKWLESSQLGYCQLLSYVTGVEGYDPDGILQSFYGNVGDFYETIKKN